MVNHSWLLSVITETMTCTSDLLTLLESETQALTQRDHGTLENIIIAKQEKLNLLNELDATIKSIITKHGYSTDPDGTERFLGALNCEKINQNWKILLAQLDKLSKQNRINANLVNLTQRYVENTLHILQGKMPENKLYDPAGQEITSRQSRTIAKT